MANMRRDMGERGPMVNGHIGKADSVNGIDPSPEVLDAVVVGAG